MKTLLCYGDSNTWGYATGARAGERYLPAERWPGVLRQTLGDGWTVIEEGLSGRTTVHPDPIEGVWLNGAAYLLPCLRTHRPLDAVIVMLGTNDLKQRFNVPASDIAAGIEVLLKIIRQSEAGIADSAPKVLVVCPPPILDHHGERRDLEAMFAGGYEKSLRLAPLVREITELYGAAFLNAGDVINSSSSDGIHFDAPEHARLGRAIADAVVKLVG